MTGSPTITVVVPAGWHDPAHPSGGNTYDARLVDGLVGRGWPVEVATVDTGDERRTAAALESAVAAAPGPVVVDGLVLRPVPALGRGDVVALVHLPRGLDPALREEERAALAAVAGVVATSPWTTSWLAHQLGPAATTVVPGVDREPVARGGGGMLSVGAVTPVKGHDVLVEALARIDHHATVVGALDLAPRHVAELRRRGRLRLTGPLTGAALARAYDAADLLVLPSRTETWGLVVGEALARGIPVVASDVGAVALALGLTPDGRRPGALVPPGEPGPLAAELEAWWGDPALRAEWRDAALVRRTTLPPWRATVTGWERVLNRLGRSSVSGV